MMRTFHPAALFPATLVALLALKPVASTAQQPSTLQSRTLIAVLELEANNVPEPEARAIADRLRYHLANQAPFRVLERGRMETILEEVGFQISGACNSEECVIQVGKILGVSKMVAGSVSKVGEIYALQIRLVDVQTSSIDRQAISDVEGIELVLQEGTRLVAEDLASQEESQPVETPVSPEEEDEPGELQMTPGQRPILGSGWSIGLWFANPADEAHQGITLGRQLGERSFLAYSGYFFSMASDPGGEEGSSTELAVQFDPFNSRVFRMTLGFGGSSIPTGNVVGETTEQTRGLTVGFTVQTGRLLLRFGSIPSPETGGYFGFAYYAAHKDKMKAIKIDGGKGPVAPSIENVINGTYSPLSRPLFVYVKESAMTRPEVREFVQFIMTEGSALVTEVGYVPLPKAAYATAWKHFNDKKLGTVFGGHAEVGITIEELLTKEAKL